MNTIPTRVLDTRDPELRAQLIPRPRDHATVTFWQTVWTCVALALVGGFVGALIFGALS